MAEAAAEDAVVLADAGFTDVMVQDASDEPQPMLAGPPTVAALSVIGAAVRRSTNISLGVIIGHNDGASSVAIAHAIDAQFVRVKVLTGVSTGPTGWIEGCSLQVGHMKRLLGSDVEVWADAHEATSLAVTGDVRWAAAEARSFGGANKLIVTRDSGVDNALSDILIGGRVTSDNFVSALNGSDGAILGSALKAGSGYDARIDPARARLFGALRLQREN